MRRNLPGPRSCTVHDHRRTVVALASADAADLAIRQENGGRGLARHNIDATMPGGLYRGFRQRTRIDAALAQQCGRTMRIRHRRLQLRQRYLCVFAACREMIE